jgi:hypothetical protein
MRRGFNPPQILVQLQEHVLRQLFGHFPVPQEAERQAKDHGLVVGKEAGEINRHNRYYG